MRRSDEITISSRDGCYSAVACFFLFFLSTTFAFAHQRSRKCAANQHSLPVYSFTRSSFSLPCSPLRTCERRFFHWQRPPTANWTSSRRMSAFGRILIFCRILIQNEKFFFDPRVQWIRCLSFGFCASANRDALKFLSGRFIWCN